MAQLGVIAKLAADLDPILYPLAALSAAYLLIMGALYWIRNNPDKWQRVLLNSGYLTLKGWVTEKWHHFREGRNLTWHL